MIFGQTIGLGGPIGDQVPSPAVKDMQNVMLAISKLLNEPDYDPKTIDGRVGLWTTSALYAMSHDLAGKGVNIPVIGEIINKLINFPGVEQGLSCLRDREGDITDPCSFEMIWKAIKLIDEKWLVTHITTPIANGAVKINSVLKPLAERLPGASSSGPPRAQHAGMVQMQLLPIYPKGTVAVRDPALGKYRLLSPPVTK